MDNIKIVALAGLDEKGRDCYVLEINDDMFVIDAGASLPDKTIPGIDFLLPNANYIINNKHRLKAYILTHGHDEQMSALKYFYDAAPAPIYCTRFTKKILNWEAKNKDVETKVPFQICQINATDDFEIAGHKVHTFQTAHNVPGSCGVAFETDRGNIVYSSDFIVDYSLKEKDYIFDFQAVSRISDKPTFLLLEESKAATKPGYCAPRHKVRDKIIKYFRDENKRIFIDCFWQNVYRIQEIVTLCKEFNKKIYCYNKYTFEIMS